MRIGILSLYYKSYNYGGLLQAYALQKVLNQFGECEQICIDMDSKLPSSKMRDKLNRKGIMEFVDRIPYKIIEIKYKFNFIKKKLIKFSNKNIYIRKKNFEIFRENIPHSKNLYYDINYKEMYKDYNIIVVGSDQVWANWIPNSIFDIYTLASNKKIKGIAYAASISSKKINRKHTEIFKTNLPAFSSISVREKSAKEQIESIDKNLCADVVCDPTLLLSRKDWDEVAKIPAITEKYIFCYFLGNNKSHKRFAEGVAKSNGMKIVYCPYINKNNMNISDITFGDIRNFTAGPREFIGLIKNAEVIITDSFHAMVFSVIYNKCFFVLMRDKFQSKDSMNDRIIDFLNMIGLDSQIVVNQKKTNIKIFKLDYNNVEKELSILKDKSLRFIRNNI